MEPALIDYLLTGLFMLGFAVIVLGFIELLDRLNYYLRSRNR